MLRKSQEMMSGGRTGRSDHQGQLCMALSNMWPVVVTWWFGQLLSWKALGLRVALRDEQRII